MPNAREHHSSSPWSTLDAHYDQYELGETEEQQVASATSWEANPTVTEAATHQLETDEETWRREYGAIPMAAGERSFFDPRAIDDAFSGSLVIPRMAQPGEHVTAGGDFAFRRNSSGLVIVHREDKRYRVGELLELRPTGGPLVPSQVCQAFAGVIKRHGASNLMADQHYRESIYEHLTPHKIGLLMAPTDVPSTFVRLRTVLHQGLLQLPEHKQLKRDMIETQSRPTAAGRLSIMLPTRAGGAHADLLSALVLAVWQKTGYEVPHAAQLPEGWSQEEIDMMEACERRIERRNDDSYYDEGDEW
jgi:hypothetical protein